MDLAKISAVLIVKNAQATLQECLESLSDFGEIVVMMDKSSSDDSLNIVKNFALLHKGVMLYESHFIGFGELKNLAVQGAKNEWIFSIDSDEVLTKGALNEIKALNLEQNCVISLPRENLYKGEWIKACGWYPDFVRRIFNKNHTKFNNNIVHESVEIKEDSKQLFLQNGIRHYAYNGIFTLLEKMQFYSKLWAEQRFANNAKSVSMVGAILHGSFNFMRNYFFKRGVFYGYKGFMISLCNGLGAFFKYAKLYELQNTKPQSVSLIITTYNQKEYLKKVLESIRHLEPLPNEVLVADDGSREDTKELVESFMDDFPIKLRHIWQSDDGFRLSHIRNKAINAANGEYCIIIDGDMVLEKHFIADHLKFAKEKVFLQGSRVIVNKEQTEAFLKDSSQGIKAGGIKKIRCGILSRLIFKNSKITKEIFKKQTLIRGIRGCNMSFYKKDCLEILGFNENFTSWGREDSEFVARFLFNGGELRRLKFGAIAYHLYHKENSKAMLESNHNIYLSTLKTEAIKWELT